MVIVRTQLPKKDENSRKCQIFRNLHQSLIPQQTVFLRTIVSHQLSKLFFCFSTNTGDSRRQRLKNSTSKGIWNVTSHLSSKKQNHHLQNLFTNYSSPKWLAEATCIVDFIKSDNFLLASDYLAMADNNWTMTVSENQIWKCLMKFSYKKVAGPEGIPKNLCEWEK